MAGCPAPRARLLWDARHDPAVLSIEAFPIGYGVKDSFDLSRFADLTTIIIGQGGVEHVVLADGYRRLRLDVLQGSLRQGPAYLHYRLEGLVGVEARVLTLHRLLALWRLGRFARQLHPPERRARRWIATLRAYDAISDGASHRDIAVALYGERAVSLDWGRGSDVLRLRIQRLLRMGRQMATGGYRLLLL